MKETGKSKEISLSLFSSPVFLQCVPLAELSRKPVDKGACEVQFAEFEVQHHRAKYEREVLEERYSR